MVSPAPTATKFELANVIACRSSSTPEFPRSQVTPSLEVVTLPPFPTVTNVPLPYATPLMTGPFAEGFRQNQVSRGCAAAHQANKQAETNRRKRRKQRFFKKPALSFGVCVSSPLHERRRDRNNSAEPGLSASVISVISCSAKRVRPKLCGTLRIDFFCLMIRFSARSCFHCETAR